MLDKWKPIIEDMGMTGSKSEWMDKYAEQHSLIENQLMANMANMGIPKDMFGKEEESLLPLSIKVTAQTIAQEIVSVQPMSSPSGESEGDRIKREKKIRDAKIDAILEDKDFKLTDDMKAPANGISLFYIDYQYGTSSKK